MRSHAVSGGQQSFWDFFLQHFFHQLPIRLNDGRCLKSMEHMLTLFRAWKHGYLLHWMGILGYVFRVLIKPWLNSTFLWYLCDISGVGHSVETYRVKTSIELDMVIPVTKWEYGHSVKKLGLGIRKTSSSRSELRQIAGRWLGRHTESWTLGKQVGIWVGLNDVKLNRVSREHFVDRVTTLSLSTFWSVPLDRNVPRQKVDRVGLGHSSDTLRYGHSINKLGLGIRKTSSSRSERRQIVGRPCGQWTDRCLLGKQVQ